MPAPNDQSTGWSALDPAEVVTALSRLLAEDDQGRAAGRPLLTGVGVVHLKCRLQAARARLDGDNLQPRWDPVGRRLWLGTRLLKTFRQPAPAQAAILAAFERRGWPPGPVPDPLCRGGRRLRETVRTLNNGLPPEALHFVAAGGQVYCWWAGAESDGV
jgi:hypothetical protein